MEIRNLLSNPNVKIIEKKGNIQIIEYQKDLSVTPYFAQTEYFASTLGIRKKQALIQLNNDAYTISSGAMQWTAGNVSMVSNVKGVGDFMGKVLSSTVTNESAIKPKYQGSGFLMLEPTYKHLLIEDLEAWGNFMVIDDGLFLASQDQVQHKIVARSNLSSAILGREGLFNLSLQGNGLVILESPVPRSELIEVILNNEEIRIDGNFAIAWSGSLNFTVEKSTKSLISSVASGEGLVNVYRGTGRILMANTLPNIFPSQFIQHMNK